MSIVSVNADLQQRPSSEGLRFVLGLEYSLITMLSVWYYISTFEIPMYIILSVVIFTYYTHVAALKETSCQHLVTMANISIKSRGDLKG